MPYKDYSQHRIQAQRYYAEHREEQTARRKQTYDANKETINAKRRKDRLANLEHHLELNRASWERHKNTYNAKRREDRAIASQEQREKWREQQQAYYAANCEELKQYQRDYRTTHREELNKKRMVYKKKNKDMYNVIRQRRRAFKAQSAINDFTNAQWQEMKAAYGHRCVYCGRKMQRLTQDHIIPLSKNGTHTASNIVPACHTCNAKKQAGHPPVPVQPLLLTVAPSWKPKEKKAS